MCIRDMLPLNTQSLISHVCRRLAPPLRLVGFACTVTRIQPLGSRAVQAWSSTATLNNVHTTYPSSGSLVPASPATWLPLRQRLPG